MSTTKELNKFTFNILSEVSKLKHGVFLRHGGFSQGPYCSLNLSYDVNDDPLNVNRNIALVCSHFGLEKAKGEKTFSRMIWANQCHGDNIITVGHHPLSTIPFCDALCTNKTQIGLMIKHADCQATIFYDPINHALANVHAGWRGSVLNIYRKTINTMKDKFGSRPQEILVGVSPSLGPHSAEFIHYQTELPKEFHAFQTKPAYFDFWAITRYQLESCQILPDHIEIAGIDTYTHAHDFFSYRRDQVTGRHGTVAMLL